MRRLRNHRSPDPDEQATEGFDRSDLEGAAIGPSADEIPWLKPFGVDFPGPVLPPSPGGGLSGEPAAGNPLHEAGELIRLGRRLDAMLLLRRSLRDEPASGAAAARRLLAELLDQGGEPEAALVELGLALESEGDRFPVLIQRGALLARLTRLAESERDLRDAVRLRPSEPAGHYQLGLALLRRGRAADAVEALEQAIRFAPTDPEILYQLGEALHSSGDLNAALETLQRAAAQSPRDPRPLKLLGRLLDGLGRTEEAMAMHRRARDAALP
jgi:tetratricopeptide (TPR) repeat protein